MSGTQAPLGSGFGPTSTADEVALGIDLSGSTAVVTGGGSGIGVPTVHALRAAGAEVIVPVLDVTRAGAAIGAVPGVELRPMDLMDPASVDGFVEWFLHTGRPLHLLVANAGIGGAPLARDARGYESHFATNHLGHFQLTCRLWPALRRTGGARIVAVSSWGHRHADVDFDDPHYVHRAYEPTAAYGQSKTANVLFAVAADRRGEADGIRAFSLHPGAIVESNLARHTPPELLRAAGMVDDAGNVVLDPDRGWKSIDQGAATSVWCATSPQLAGLGGLYAQDCDIAPLVEVPDDATTFGRLRFTDRPLGVMAYAVDPDRAERLWELSERQTGVRTGG